MRIFYFAGGTNRENTLLKVIDNFNVVAIAVANIEKAKEIYKKIAQNFGIDFYVFSKENIIKLFDKKDAQILLSVGYRYLIPKEIFSQFEFAINIHPSLLPKYKGAYSGYAIIENGEKETGITAHFIDEGIDTGDIIKQITIPIDEFDTIITISQKIREIEPSFTIEVLKEIQNNSFSKIKQPPNSYPPYNKKRKFPEDFEIDPNKTILELYNKLRSFYPNPGYFKIKNKKIFIKIEIENNL